MNNSNLPKTKLSGLKICPNGPDRTESMVPGSKSTSTARGTYLPPEKNKSQSNYAKILQETIEPLILIYWTII